MSINKVDMSLDDIIKLNKKQNRTSRGQGRGRIGAGATRGGNKIKQFRTNLRGGMKSRGQGQRGGRGRLRRLSTGISPLNRPQVQSSPNKGQGQGQKQSLKDQRLKAVLALRKAKQQLARIDAQATRRQNVVSQRRGLQQTAQQQYSNSFRGRGQGRGGRGQGRGRGGRGRLSKSNFGQNRLQAQTGVKAYNLNQNYIPTTGRGQGRGRLQRLGQNFNSTLSLNSSAGSVNSVKRKKRQWRKQQERPVQAGDDGILTISLPNPNYSPPKQETAGSRFNYNKKLFAQSSTNVSLSDRFNQGSSGDRQVFL